MENYIEFTTYREPILHISCILICLILAMSLRHKFYVSHICVKKYRNVDINNCWWSAINKKQSQDFNQSGNFTQVTMFSLIVPNHLSYPTLRRICIEPCISIYRAACQMCWGPRLKSHLQPSLPLWLDKCLNESILQLFTSKAGRGSVLCLEVTVWI